MAFGTNSPMYRSNRSTINCLTNQRFARKLFVIILSVVAVLGIIRVSQRVSETVHSFLLKNVNNAQYEINTRYNISFPGFNESFLNRNHTPPVSIRRWIVSPNNIAIEIKTTTRKTTTEQQTKPSATNVIPKITTIAKTTGMLKTTNTVTASQSLTTVLTSNPAQSLTCNRTEWVYKPVPESSHLCSECPDTLLGYVFPGENGTHEEHFNDSDVKLTNQAGGSWEPSNCTAQHMVAVIIPFRDRHSHLTALLAHLHPIMQRQLLKYQIFVVEQKGNLTFNKARIMNIGFSHAMNTSKWDCVIFHDVDLIPENDLNMYACPQQPRHLSPAIDEFRYVYVSSDAYVIVYNTPIAKLLSSLFKCVV